MEDLRKYLRGYKIKVYARNRGEYVVKVKGNGKRLKFIHEDYEYNNHRLPEPEGLLEHIIAEVKDKDK